MQSALQNKDLALQATGIQLYFPESSSKWDSWQEVIASTYQPPAQASLGGYQEKKQNNIFK